MMDNETRSLWQIMADRYQQKCGVYRRTGSKGCEAPVIESYDPKRRKLYIEIVKPERTAK